MGDDVASLLSGRHKLRIGDSFIPTPRYTYHALRYDFKPASIDPNSPSTVLVGSGNDVTVIPDGEKSQIVFKGNKRPCQKEGILIFDPNTGEFTLERLNTTLQVKKSRDNVLPRALPPVTNTSDASLDSSPKHGKQSLPSSSKQADVKRPAASSNAATLNAQKKPSPGHVPATTKPSQPAVPPRFSAPSGRINVLKDDLNLSESSDDD